jgi:hypothetical protein
MFIGLHVNTRCSSPILMKHGFSRHICEKYSNIKLHENPYDGSRALPRGRTDRQTDMTKLIVTFWDSANAPENYSFQLWNLLEHFALRMHAHQHTEFLNVHWKRMFQQKLCHESLTSSPVLMLTCVITCQMSMSVIMSVSVLIMNE